MDGKSSPSEPIDAQIGRIAARQDNVVGLAQLYGLGLSDEAIRGRVRRGYLFPLHCAVFAVGHPQLTSKGHLKAALLSLGPESFLSGWSSAAGQGLSRINVHAIEITVVANRTPKRPGLIVHRTRKPPHRSEVRTRFGLRYSSFARTLIELAPRETPEEMMRLVTESVRKRIFDSRAVQEALDRHRRQPGTGILRLLLDRYLDPHDRKSGLERSFDAYAETDPRIPPYDKNVHLGPYEIDCSWPTHGLVLELDGRPWHIALQDMDRDRAKDIWLQRHGLRVMRITDFAWTYDQVRAVDDLLALLEMGQRRAA